MNHRLVVVQIASIVTADPGRALDYVRLVHTNLGVDQTCHL
jgi:hypothetical protein